MIILDFLFNICFSPFRNAIKGGRIGALLILTPSLTFVVSGIINLILYQLIGKITHVINPAVLGLGMLLIFYGIYYFLNKTYITENREVYRMRFPVFYVLIMLVFFLGSIIFFGLTVSEFG